MLAEAKGYLQENINLFRFERYISNSLSRLVIDELFYFRGYFTIGMWFKNPPTGTYYIRSSIIYFSWVYKYSANLYQVLSYRYKPISDLWEYWEAHYNFFESNNIVFLINVCGDLCIIHKANCTSVTNIALLIRVQKPCLSRYFYLYFVVTPVGINWNKLVRFSSLYSAFVKAAVM